MKPVYKTVLITSIVIAIAIYALLFNKLSETAMVRWSYFWVPGVVYGAVGLIWPGAGSRRPIIAAAIAVVALIIFFEGIFPSL